jgi:DNA primase
LLDESMSLSEYFLSKVKDFNLETLEGRSQAAKFAIPVISKINNAVIKEIYANEVSKLCGMDVKSMQVPQESYKTNQSSNQSKASPAIPVRVKALINIFSALLKHPSLAQQDVFKNLKEEAKFNFLFDVIDLYQKSPDMKPSRVLETLESEQIQGYFSQAVIAELDLSEENALKLIEDCINVLLKNQKEREQILKDKYNVSSITSVERRDLQQIILKKEEIADDDRDWLKKLSSNQD